MTDIRASYDSVSDVLYVSTEANGSAVGREADDGIIWRYLDSDGRLVGATIMDFDAHWKKHLVVLIRQISTNFHVGQQAARKVINGAHR